MRRISLALALLGAVAAAGCGGAGSSSPASAGGNKGVEQASFKLVVRGEGSFTQGASTFILPKGGVVTAAAAGIDCGTSWDATNLVTVLHTSCEATLPYSTANVAVTATPTSARGYAVWGWAGACTGTGACSFPMTDTRTLAIRFAANTASLGAHGPFTDPAIHVPEYNKWANNVPGAYTCYSASCHGANGQGVGLAPSCSMCHGAPPPASPLPSGTGLVATVTGITLTSPITVSFTLKDNAGNGVDISTAATTNLPISNCGHGSSLPSQGCSNTTIGFALGYFSVGANSYNTSGIVSPYTIYPAGTSPTMLSPTKMGDNTTKGVLTQVSTGTYTYKFPTSVALDASKLANTHTLFLYATRQEDMSGGACTGAGPFTACPAAADNHKTFTAVNVIWNFDATTGLASANKREIVNPAGCNACHDGFKPTGAVSSAFHSGNKIDGRICNVCHNPARTSSPWANSAQAFHRIHAYAEEGMPAYACVDVHKPSWDPLAAVSVNGSIYAGGGNPAVIPTGINDVSTCNAATYAAIDPSIVPTVKAIAFDSTGLDLTYPQDIRNCDQCHAGAAQGAQYNTNASPTACNSCHANNLQYWYTSQAGIDGEMAFGAPAFVPGAVNGDEAGNIVKAHPKLAVSPPDPQGCLLQNGAQPAGCNGNTNAAYLANAGQVPVGADTWAYDVSSVGLDGSGHLQMTFRLLKNGTAVPLDFCTKAAGSAAQTDPLVLFNNTYGGPSVYFAWAVPQDGIAQPADFNGSASAYLPAVCAEGHTGLKGKNAATITGPDSNQYYTVTLTYTANLTTAISMLTGGLGYTYAPASTPPLTQTNVGSFPVTMYNVTSGTVYGTACSGTAACATKTGGLVVPIKNVWKVGTGYTGRRVIVDNARCDACHARLGARPTFHAGQRNDAPTCSFCHKPNQGSGGWSANASTFAHGIHAADMRNVKFAWEGGCNIGSTFRAIGTPPGQYWYYGDCIDNSVTSYDATKIVAPRFYYPEVTYPGSLACSECHTDGFFAQTVAAESNLLWTTYAQGTSAYGVAANTAYPYINPATVYGAGFAFDPAFPNSTVQATGTTLVGSPITAACVACHDNPSTVTHMQSSGGHFYEARSTALVNMASETCLNCHGSGQLYDVTTVHP